MPKISVLIATFNRADELIRTLNSLLNQDLDPAIWEIVIVDNNSSDHTKLSCEHIIERNPTFVIKYVFEKKQGLSHARNCGIEHSSGEYIVIVDDDEEFSIEFLSAYLEAFESNPKIEAAGGRVTPLYEFKTPEWLNPYCERPIAGTVSFSPDVKYFPIDRYPTGGNMAFRSSAFKKYGVFNPELGRKGTSLMGGEEKDLFQRVTSSGSKILYVYDALMYHIIPESRVTTEYVYKVANMIGISERVRTQSLGSGSYLKRLFIEAIKWAGTLVIALGYALNGKFSAARVLIGLRVYITKGLVQGAKRG